METMRTQTQHTATPRASSVAGIKTPWDAEDCFPFCCWEPASLRGNVPGGGESRSTQSEPFSHRTPDATVQSYDTSTTAWYTRVISTNINYESATGHCVTVVSYHQHSFLAHIHLSSYRLQTQLKAFLNVVSIGDLVNLALYTVNTSTFVTHFQSNCVKCPAAYSK